MQLRRFWTLSMLRKTTIYKRKLKGFSFTIFLSFLIFVLVFGLACGIWWFIRMHASLLSPLPKTVVAKNENHLLDQIQALCTKQNLSCQDIVIHTDQTATMTIDGGEIVILSLRKDLTSQITSLQLTSKQLTMNNKRFRRIDFRFDKPVLTY